MQDKKEIPASKNPIPKSQPKPSVDHKPAPTQPQPSKGKMINPEKKSGF